MNKEEPKIISKQVLCEYNDVRVTKIKVYSPTISTHYQPGQFVIIMVTEKGERIPLTITDTNTNEGSITLIFQEIGYTTKLLGRLNEGDGLYHIVGPLGRPTELKKFGAVLIIGGGVGTAEAYPVGRALKQAGNKLIVILGARNKSLVILEDEFRKISDELYITTDDGSYGEKGFVTDVLQRLLTNNKNIDLVYAVGPIPMMKAVSNLTLQYNLKTIVSLNTIMVDGTGMCGSCRITYDSKIRYVCCDGPEFDAHKIDWQEISNRNNSYLQQEKEILRRLT